MKANDIIDKYIKFFEKRGHKRILNSPLVPENDPTTLFTSSGMQPLIPYLLGEPHPSGKRLVNVQNCFRAVDIDEVGDNRHTTFFRMLGNWSLGDYFKKEEIPWLWEFLTKELGLPKEKLYITVFDGYKNVPYDQESEEIWKEVLAKSFGSAQDSRIFADNTNWWSRSGIPDNMPPGEPGGPDTEVYFRFDDIEHRSECKDNPVDCVCGKFLEISNSVFMQYKKESDGSIKLLPKPNVDFGGGVERLLAAVEDKSDIFMTSLFTPIIKAVEEQTGKIYKDNEKQMRIVTDHLRASVYLLSAKIAPSNKDRGYILRRLIRRALDNLGQAEIEPVLSAIVEECSKTDTELLENFEEIKTAILEEKQGYKKTVDEAVSILGKGKGDDSTQVVREITAEEAFKMYSTHGLSPTQIKSLGYNFDEQKFAELMENHQKKSRTASAGMFRGGLADHSELTIRGHTATHLLHQAIRDLLGEKVHQVGSNITSERVRFDFNYDKLLTPEEISKLEQTVSEKIKENLPVHFEMLALSEAKKIGAIGLFDEKYQDTVKVYFIGPKSPSTHSVRSGQSHTLPYSIEFCGGPHVDFTSKIKSFKIIKQENLGKGSKRLYAKVG